MGLYTSSFGISATMATMATILVGLGFLLCTALITFTNEQSAQEWIDKFSQPSNCRTTYTASTSVDANPVNNVLYSDLCIATEIGGNPAQANYGAWPLCITHIEKNSNPIIYSFGVGRDISFDLDMIKRYNATVYGFDPTIEQVDVQMMLKDETRRVGGKYLFHKVGAGVCDSLIDFYKPVNGGSLVSTTGLHGYKNKPAMQVPVYSIPSLLRKMGHAWVDVLKFDIEGTEFGIFLDPKTKVATWPTSNILIEQHSRLFVKTPWNRRSLTGSLISKMDRAGFKLITKPEAWEMSFIRVR